MISMPRAPGGGFSSQASLPYNRRLGGKFDDYPAPFRCLSATQLRPGRFLRWHAHSGCVRSDPGRGPLPLLRCLASFPLNWASTCAAARPAHLQVIVGGGPPAPSPGWNGSSSKAVAAGARAGGSIRTGCGDPPPDRRRRNDQLLLQLPPVSRTPPGPPEVLTRSTLWLVNSCAQRPGHEQEDEGLLPLKRQAEGGSGAPRQGRGTAGIQARLLPRQKEASTGLPAFPAEELECRPEASGERPRRSQ